MQSNDRIKLDIKIAGHWLCYVDGSENIYVKWHRPGFKSPGSKSLGTTDPALAEVRLAEFVAKKSAPVEAREDELQIAIALGRYWDEYAKDLPSAESTKWAIGKALDFFGTEKVEGLGALRQEQFLAHLRKDELADESINMCFSRIRSALKREHRLQRLKSVPYIMSIKDPVSKETPIVDEDGLGRMIEWSRRVPYLFRFVMLSCNTLSRPCALFDLKPPQCDFVSGLIHLNPPGRRQTKKFRPIVPMTDTIRPLLESWMADTPAELPFVNRAGAAIPNLYNDTQFKNMVKDSGVVATPYSIRHTMATLLNREGVDDSHIAREMGHAAPKVSKTTLRYLHHQPTYLRDVSAALDTIMGRILPTAPVIAPALSNNVISIKRPLSA